MSKLSQFYILKNSLIYIDLKEKRIIRIDKTLPYITNDGKPNKETRITARDKWISLNLETGFLRL